MSDHTLVTIELGYGLVQLVDERHGSPLVTRVTGVRKQLSQAFGFIVPQFRVRDALDMPPARIPHRAGRRDAGRGGDPSPTKCWPSMPARRAPVMP